MILPAACVAPAMAQDSNGPSPFGFLDTSNYLYDQLVDSSLAQDDPANGRFRTLQAAYAAAPAGTPTRQTVIGIKPDVYQITGTTTRCVSPVARVAVTRNQCFARDYDIAFGLPCPPPGSAGTFRRDSPIRWPTCRRP